MPDRDYPDPREEDVVYDDRRISRPDSSLPDWWVSDTSYRPIPIVWFTGAVLMQIFSQLILLVVLHIVLGLAPLVTVAAAMLGSGLVWYFTMERGMQQAAAGWRFATGAMLTFFFGITALTALA